MNIVSWLTVSRSKSKIFEEPIRSEIFSEARMEMHGRSLAEAQPVTKDPQIGRDLAPRIRDNRRVLEESYFQLLKAVEEKRAVTPAADWILDNFHIVRAQLREIHDHLPPEYYRELPKLAEGPLAGYPRVYGIAWAFVAHTDSRFDADLLKRFLKSYQSVQPLTIGELWAVSITIRVVLIENLRRLSQRITRSQMARKEADEFADELLELGEKMSRPISLVIDELSERPFFNGFAVQLLQRLRFQEARLDPVLDWLSRRLAQDHLTADEVVSAEHASQTGANATVRNIITSARLMSAFDWQAFFEEVSLVDEVLNQHELYREMDFATRDRYRHGIEELALNSPLTELELAQLILKKTLHDEAMPEPLTSSPAHGSAPLPQAVHAVPMVATRADLTTSKEASPAQIISLGGGAAELSAAAATDFRRQYEVQTKLSNRALNFENDEDRRRDPGYYLISTGRKILEEEIGFRSPFSLSILRWYMKSATPIYLFSILVLTFATLLLPLEMAARSGADWFELAILALVGLFPASEIAIAAINRISIEIVGPRHLPRLKLERGVPEEYKTFVVVPTMFSDRRKIEAQLEHLEIHYLSNTEGMVHFALLTDWTDATEESVPGDELLLQIAVRKLDALNEKYGTLSDGSVRFHIFHRRRQWNPGEQKWIGWERKRGKLHEFNQLLLGSKTTSFIPLPGREIRPPVGVRYVITLDADTKMPNGAVIQLVGTLAHPLNRARFNSDRTQVIGGYGILQPRITPSLPSTSESTLFQRFSTGPSGVDPYASAVSDVYQDLFGSGTFTGKGIYDVEVFETALAGRIPENSLLSHDLFEGSYARCGFLSDVEFFEDFPSHTEVAAARNHRWTRGDWQLLPWVFGSRGRDLSVISRWKMIDNLRRSLLAPMMVLTLVIGLASAHAWPLGWILLFFFSLSISAIVPFVVDIIPGRNNLPVRLHFKSVFHDLALGGGRFILFLTLLPYHAWLSLDAIARALYRLFISHKKMLQWTTAAQAKLSATLELKSFLSSMVGGVAISVGGLVAILCFDAKEVPLYLPFFVMWFASPALAQNFSRPPKPKLTRPLEPGDIQLLHLTARKIWRFFATFVTAEEHYLPPDNFQEDPAAVVAHRSSPTNFGLYLMSVLAARDFGWIGTMEMTTRLENTLRSMERLPRFQGHFYNWYETTEARVLEPKYISSVDNGNLGGHLLVVAQGCLETMATPVSVSGFNRGLLQTLLLLGHAIELVEPTTSTRNVQAALDRLAAALLTPDHMIENRGAHWQKLQGFAHALVDSASTLCGIGQLDETVIAAGPGAERRAEVLAWARALQNDIKSSTQDFERLVPWAEFASAEVDLPEPFERKMRELLSRLNTALALREIPSFAQGILGEISEMKRELVASAQPVPELLNALAESLETSLVETRQLTQKLSELYKLCHQLINDMDFGLLYDPVRKLFSIGYRVADNALDASYYDLLASEARLTSFLAVAKGDVPASHWFNLGRTLTLVEKAVVLVSWSGSMFEYLMPSLVMNTPPGSLIDKTCHQIVKRQIQYGHEKNVPWGISESAYNKRDLHLTYQYTNFGIPDLGLKRGLDSDLVIAPYATLLAAMYEPTAAVENLRKIRSMGGEGAYGFYEALDFTPSRLQEGSSVAVIKCYMAHHQGMALISIANIFKNGVMRQRFHAEPAVQAAELLLQERTPRNVGVAKPFEESFHETTVREEVEHASRKYHTVNRPVPTTELLANGDYAVMLTSSGSGYSRYKNTAVTRWREDVTLDNRGTYFYLRDATSGDIWSAGYHPTCVETELYEVTFAEDRARFLREDHKIACELEVFVSPEDSAEVRKLTLTNRSETVREIEVTSYAEVVLNTQLADQAHPAFSNLFVQTEYLAEMNALLATRRARSSQENPLWLAHVLLPNPSGQSSIRGVIQYETDRARFVGRGQTLRSAQAVQSGEPLSNTVGSVLDPVFSLRARVRLEPGATCQLIFSTMVAESREQIITLADKFRDLSTIDRATDLAWTQAQVKLHYLNIEPDEAHLFQRLATRLLFSESSLRPSAEIIRQNHRDVTGLWAHGISGDYPIILVRIDDIEDRGIVRQLLKAHEYLGTKLLTADLVILNDKANSYAQELQNSLEAMVHGATVMAGSSLAAVRGKIFILRSDILSHEDRLLLYASARVVVSSRQGSLAEQVKRTRPLRRRPALLPPKPYLHSLVSERERPHLDFFNGYGGFLPNGKEYQIALKPGVVTPAPWINVVANAGFGFTASEVGSGYTWASNSRENQITPWSNDPVCDPSGEAFFFKDLDTGLLWSPTASPIRVPHATYHVAHGQGYSRFECAVYGLASTLTQFVPMDQSVKISQLIVENRSHISRSISICSYVEWVLGFTRSTMAPTTVTEYDDTAKAMFALNSRSNEYGSRVSFAAFSEPFSETPSAAAPTGVSFTGDRTEFIGRNGTLAQPAALDTDKPFSGKTGAALDPCAALLTKLTIEPGARVEISFYLGQSESREDARELLTAIRAKGANQILHDVREYWDEILTKIEVETPDRAMNLMLNRWLLYQTLVCRFWARTAFYQAGGAFGFRDQLQDLLALVTSQPQLSREHIIRAASRQFVEGDVQHWWHPPFGRGVRTHFSDDLLWLPYVLSHYLSVTHDRTVLDEDVSFLEAPLLRPDQEDSYNTPSVSHNSDSIYEHCARALDHSLKTGVHGLPLIGAGDWNDGMNRVGHEGKGESVWLAWFLYTNLVSFSEVAKERGDFERSETWIAHAKKLQVAVEKEAWDGNWYRRAFFDDGTPIGSASSDECKIDSLSQTWAVISGAGEPGRTEKAMDAVNELLVKKLDAMILLFTPPFDKTPADPGYIKGYLPGVRENGGQYTHAAVWCVIAEALSGHAARASELFHMLNPIGHSSSEQKARRYKVEPYVLAADVYSQAPYTGRGGWTWYTGSSGWMYRAGIEYILGIKLSGNYLLLNPCVSPEWHRYKIRYRHGKSAYELEFVNDANLTDLKSVYKITALRMDGEVSLELNRIELKDDGRTHKVQITLA